MFECLDQYGHRLFFEMDEDFLQGPLHPDHFRGDVNANFAQRSSLVFKPLAMALDITQPHLVPAPVR